MVFVVNGDTPEQAAAAAADMSLAFIEGQADVWAEQINLSAMIDNVIRPMYLTRNTPDQVRASFTKRMKEQIDALMRLAFIEGAARAIDNFTWDEAIPGGGGAADDDVPTSQH